MFKLSYYVFGFENKYCCLFLINKGTLLYDQPSYMYRLIVSPGNGGAFRRTVGTLSLQPIINVVYSKCYVRRASPYLG